MSILVTGRGGQLSSEFEKLFKKNKNWIFLCSKKLDITNQDMVYEHFSSKSYDFVINCAAYTNVNKAENNKEQAFLVNQYGVRNLLKGCEISNSKFIHFSTDYVFNGKTTLAYNELSKAAPLNVYGKSKYAGELEILRSKIDSLIIRTSWLYSSFGHNFVKTILSTKNHKKQIHVIDDQIGSPTFAADLVRFVIYLIENKNYKWGVGDVFNFSNQGSCSWYEFASEITKYACLDLKLIKSLSECSEFEASRPKFSVLDTSKSQKTFDFEFQNWKTSLKKMLNSELISR